MREPKAGKEGKLVLRSAGFVDGDWIPCKYTCEGQDLSPPLQWVNVPKGTKSFALVADDPDAQVGTWVHWVLYDVPAEKDGLAEGIPAEPVLGDGAKHGKNSWGSLGYGGPCKPGGVHRYILKLYALDRPLGLGVGASKEEVLSATRGHVLAQAGLMGRYARP
jgi:Raf kinase inhibitor-like YbhB/YbcL family protein